MLYDDVQHLGFRGVRGDRFLTYPNRAGSLETCGFKQRFWSLLGLRPKETCARGRGTLPVGDMEENERAVEDAGPYKGLGESAPVSGGASMRAAGDAGPYGSESGAVSKFENISKRTDISTSRAGATRGGITNNIKNHEASQKPPLRSNGAAHYRAERGSGSDKGSVSDSLYDDVQHLGFRGVRGDRFLTYPNRAGSLETCGFKQRFWSLLGLRPKETCARGRGTLPVGDMEENERAVEDAGPYKGLGESAPVSGGASMRAAGDAGPYGSESGAVSKFENISKRTDISTSRAGARSIPLKITGKEQ